MGKGWTIKEINLLKQLAEQGKDRDEISKILGRSYSSITNISFKWKIDITNKNKFKNKIYAMYKKDDYITSGTVDELAIYLNVKPRTITFYMTDSYLKRTNDNYIRVIDIS